jgi:hypothetical protein
LLDLPGTDFRHNLSKTLMKKIILCLFAASGVVQCTEEDDLVANGYVTFAISLPAATKGDHTLAVPSNANVRVIIGDESGSISHEHILEIGRNATKLETEPLSLSYGKHFLKKFIVMSGSRKIFEHQLANTDAWKSRTELNVSAPMLKVTVEVVPVGINPDERDDSPIRNRGLNLFYISVLDPTSGKLKHTDATLSLFAGDSLFFSTRILPKINALSFEGIPSETYTLQITKDGYETRLLEFTYDQYVAQFGTQPLKIILIPEKAFTLITGTQVNLYLTFYKSGSIFIEWPDGTTDEVPFAPHSPGQTKLSFQLISRAFTTSANEIRITGDVDSIVEFVSNSRIQSLDLTLVTHLENLTLENSAIEVLDLSHNSELKTLSFVYTSIGQINLPSTHQIDNVSVEGNVGEEPSFPMDRLIANIFENAVTKNIIEGSFILFNCAPFSADSSEKLMVLQDAYSWYVEIQ